ncbi:356aaf56-ebb2-46fc-ba1c-335e226294f6 [Sclerotinia trifoliorum]|uniref:356aaf56-ebb2-46fc-ba1c-335e226294f6 n=1 Tax=Sclerotinia trifoliorum TaxID=28548 RepID=A0A8H2ZN31_9HELO|nr:356aaf56-ebb2-46fc-ba1c-335e226294f6 [Sclerotinia trifoliorum]
MRLSRAAALSLLSGIGAASLDTDCSPVTTTVYQPTTITVKESSVVTSTVTLGDYGEISGTAIYQTVTHEDGSTAIPITVTAPAQTITVDNAGTVIAGGSGSSSSSLKLFKTSNPIIDGTGSLLGAQVTSLPSADAIGAVTQMNVISGISTVQVCPTGATTYDCTEVIYGSGGEVIVIQIITVDVTIDVYGEPSTVTITKIASATSTPSLPPTHSASLVGTKTRGSSFTDKPTTAPYSYGNGSHHIYPTGGIRTGATGSHKPTGTGKSLQPIHVISVGQNGTLSFSPKYIDAEEGATVRFKFYPTNHTVTSCDVTAPCVMNGVYDSGFKPVLEKNMTTFVDFPVTNARSPLFFFSRQNNGCESGMVFAINPKSGTQYDEFTSSAKSKKTTTSHAPTGTSYSTGDIRGTGSGRPTSTHSDLGISAPGSSKVPFPTGGSNTTIGSGTRLHHIETGTGLAHSSITFKPSNSIRSSGFPHSSDSSRPTRSINGSGHAFPASSVRTTSVLSSSLSTTRSLSSSSHSTTSRTSSIVTTTSSINGYVAYSFSTPVASYVAQSYRA